MIVCIDGNIGSGKSSVLTALEQKGYNVQREKIDEWPLKEFYEDQDRWKFLMQMSVLDSMMNIPVHVIHERCPESALAVFWESDNETEDRVCKSLYEYLTWKPDVHIYLRASPEVCFERLQSRNQVGDTGVTIEYITKIHDKYEKFISARDVKVINAELSLDEVVKLVEDYLL